MNIQQLLESSNQFKSVQDDAKWKAAFEFCKDRNMTFMILTEKDLGIING